MDSEPVTMPATTRLIDAEEEFFSRGDWDWYPVVDEDWRFLGVARRESVELYRQGGRSELAAKEEAEIAVIEGFLPAQMDEAGLARAVDAAVAETGAAGPKDMGRVMAALKAAHGAALDLGWLTSAQSFSTPQGGDEAW